MGSRRRTGSTRWASFAVALVAAASGLTACSSGTPHGTLGGIADPCGIGTHFRQHVTVKRLDGSIAAQVSVVSPYRFKFVLKPGTYVVSAISARTVTTRLGAGKVTKVDLDYGCF